MAPAIDAHTPHKALLALHRIVDLGIVPLLGPMQFDWSTESVVTVDRNDLSSLTGATNDPQAALVRIEPGPDAHGLLVAEPALCRAVLARIWRSRRNETAPLTQVEGAILQQFMANLVQQWRVAWRQEGIDAAPVLEMATSLSLLQGQMQDGPWYVARTLVRDGEDPVGVLLFCYPAVLLPTLLKARDETLWRTRVEKGLTDDQRHTLDQRLTGALRDLRINAPVRMTTDLPLHMVNSLERGDVISLDTQSGTDMRLQVLDREITGRLARTGSNLSLVVTGPQPEAPAQMGDTMDAEQGYGADNAQSFFPNDDDEQHP